MPYVSVRITRGGVTTAQKARMVREITGTLQSVLGKQPEHIHVIIDEVDPENWGFAGMLTPEYRSTQVLRESAPTRSPHTPARPILSSPPPECYPSFRHPRDPDTQAPP